ncbi:MAG: HAD-IA family hydrolase [Bacteroidales bacterium]|jgi:HAD superfamily hydrolase (TIGR01509 family)|nr:HAD-IA family hydrolase [Bacteroidales bacterium]
MIQAVLFDMDGVLVDTERQICLAAVQMFKESGVTVQPEDFLPYVGAGENRYIGGVAEKYGIKLDIDTAKFRTYTIYGEIVHGQLEPLAGVREFISKCRAAGIKTAIATSADLMKMEINLREIGLPAATFDATVNGLEVEHKKPAPEIYLTAAGKVGVKPVNCLVVEDAINGVQAAKAAGMQCLALTTSFNAEQLKQADWICKDLAEALNSLEIF